MKHRTSNKLQILEAKAGKQFVTPSNKYYTFYFKVINKKYVFIIEYLGYKMQINESDYNLHLMDEILDTIELEVKKIANNEY